MKLDSQTMNKVLKYIIGTVLVIAGGTVLKAA